jgi:predicted ATP-dependent Lon-type protease
MSVATLSEVTKRFGAVAALDAVTLDEVAEIARDVADTLAIACVGPHTEGDFS